MEDRAVRPSPRDRSRRAINRQSRPIPRLPDHHLDIPEFLRRRFEPEPAEPDKKLTELPSVSVGGGGNYRGNRGGGGGGGRRSDEECRKEEQRAKKICIEAFANGTFGDIVKAWKSNYATGPFPKADDEPWSIDDCKRGFISEACGGNEYERAPPPEVTKDIGRRIYQEKKAKRDAQKAKEAKIRENWERTGKWTLGK